MSQPSLSKPQSPHQQGLPLSPCFLCLSCQDPLAAWMNPARALPRRCCFLLGFYFIVPSLTPWSRNQYYSHFIKRKTWVQRGPVTCLSCTASKWQTSIISHSLYGSSLQACLTVCCYQQRKLLAHTFDLFIQIHKSYTCVTENLYIKYYQISAPPIIQTRSNQLNRHSSKLDSSRDTWGRERKWELG